jgi:hypothetical protein
LDAYVLSKVYILVEVAAIATAGAVVLVVVVALEGVRVGVV